MGIGEKYGGKERHARTWEVMEGELGEEKMEMGIRRKDKRSGKIRGGETEMKREGRRLRKREGRTGRVIGEMC